jgi:hypothetical protein
MSSEEPKVRSSDGVRERESERVRNTAAATAEGVYLGVGAHGKVDVMAGVLEGANG